MRDKHLTEAGWRTLSGKYPAIHDNGLLKALNIYEHLGDSGDPDARLRALVQIGDFASKLRKIHEVAAIHEVAVYLDDLGKEDGKARVVVAAGKREAAKSKAEEQKADADGKKLTKAIGAELVAGLQKSKTIECPALVCVASPICGLMVATNITSQHKAQLTQFTRSTKFLPLGSCIWDGATHAYTFIMQRRESGLLLQLQQAIKCLTAMSVKVIVMTRVEYDAKQTADTEKDGAGAEFDPTENAPDAPHPSGVEDEPESQSTSMKSFALGASVGANGKNNKADVKEVQAALNRDGAQLDEDGICGAKTIGAIRDFQKLMGFTHPDGLVEPNGFTHRGLRGEDVKLPQLQKRRNPPKAGTSKPPGGSQSSDDYKEGFQDGFSGDDSHPGPRDGGALIEYYEGYAKGHDEFSQKASPESDLNEMHEGPTDDREKDEDGLGENLLETAKAIAIHKGAEEAAKFIVKHSASRYAASELAQAVELAGAAAGVVALVLSLAVGELGPGDTGMRGVDEFPFYAQCTDPHGRNQDPWAGKERRTWEEAQEDAEEHNDQQAKYSTHHARARSRNGINEEGL